MLGRQWLAVQLPGQQHSALDQTCEWHVFDIGFAAPIEECFVVGAITAQETRALGDTELMKQRSQIGFTPAHIGNAPCRLRGIYRIAQPISTTSSDVSRGCHAVEVLWQKSHSFSMRF